MSDSKEPENKPRKSIERIKTGGFERNFALTKMGLGVGAKVAGHTVRNFFRRGEHKNQASRDFYREQAQILVNELGQLKGSVMKAGQMLSLYGQYFLPEEAVEVLASLQDDTPCVSWAFVKPQLIKALGLEAVNQLNIDPEPIAAASLGQVHLATIKNSQQKVVVKIQYPGIADAISNDVATLKRLLGATRLVPKALDLSQVFNELQDMLERECDYVREREFTETFFKHLKADSRFVVPEVHAEYCADRVLTTTYQPGFSVASKEVQALSQERRNQLGQAFVDLFVREFFEWNTVQTDPHFGNYRVQIDPNGQQDKIVVLDFGATRQFTKVFVNQYTQIVKGALDCDRDLIASAVVKIGLMSHSTPQAVLYEFGELAELIVEPFRKSFHKMVPEHLYSTSGAYRFGVTDLPVRVGQTAASKMMSVHFKIPPKEIVFLHRRIAGVLVTLRVLGSELRLGELLSPYLYR